MTGKKQTDMRVNVSTFPSAVSVYVRVSVCVHVRVCMITLELAHCGPVDLTGISWC